MVVLIALLLKKGLFLLFDASDMNTWSLSVFKSYMCNQTWFLSAFGQTSVCVKAVIGIPGMRLCSKCPCRGGLMT